MNLNLHKKMHKLNVWMHKDLTPNWGAKYKYPRGQIDVYLPNKDWNKEGYMRLPPSEYHGEQQKQHILDWAKKLQEAYHTRSVKVKIREVKEAK